MAKVVRLTESDLVNLVKRVMNEQIVTDVSQLVKDVVKFIWSMNIVPGPIDGAKLLYDLYNSKNSAKTIKQFVRSRIPSPKEDWLRIENSLDKLGGNTSEFKNKLYGELKSKIKL